MGAGVWEQNNKMMNKNFEPFDDLFYRNLKTSNRNQQWNTDENNIQPRMHQDSEDVGYRLNSYGFRSSEFGTGQEILVLGCSHTFGYGMQEDKIWPHLFAKELNKEYASLAIPGDSAGGQIFKAFQYFKEFGNPKIIVASFPRDRMEMPAIPKKFGAISENFDSLKNISSPIIQKTFYGNETLTEYSKYPHSPERVIPEEVANFYTFMFIQMLQQYCDSHKIHFIYNVWNNESDGFMENMDHRPEFNKYVKLNLAVPFKCCIGISEKFWDYAADEAHWGIHKHKHLFEKMIEKYNKLY
jgi:hypothetical protein